MIDSCRGKFYSIIMDGVAAADGYNRVELQLGVQSVANALDTNKTYVLNGKDILHRI